MSLQDVFFEPDDTLGESKRQLGFGTRVGRYVFLELRRTLQRTPTRQRQRSSSCKDDRECFRRNQRMTRHRRDAWVIRCPCYISIRTQP
jgi:hypothetical protein